MLASSLGTADYAIVVVYFAATIALGFWSARRGTRSSGEFFVARKTLPWPVIGLTMVAASISAEQMLGEVGYGSGAGLVISNWDLGVLPALILMVFVFLPLYLRSGVTTIPEYLEKRFGHTTRLVFAVYTVFNNACITLVMVLALGATALRYFVGMDFRYAVLFLVVMTGVYTIYGGMLSVASTQTLQCVLLLAGGLTVTAVGLGHVPGGWSGLMDRMRAEHTAHLIRPASDPYVPWPGLLLLMLSTNVWYCCTNQFYVQSCLGARDEWHGRMGVLLTAFLGPVLTLCFAVPGYIATVLLKDGVLPPLPVVGGVPDANATYPHLIVHLLGAGWRGFLVAAVLGAIMSSVAAIVNATGSVVANDLYARKRGATVDDARLVRVAQVAGFITLVVAVPLTFFAGSYQYIFTYSQNAWCILAIPIMLVFTLGAMWRRVGEKAATATFLFIAPFVAVPFVFGTSVDNYLRFPGIEPRVHLFNFAAGLWVVAAVFLVVMSSLLRAPDPETVAPYVWRPGFGRTTDGGVKRRWYARIETWCVVATLMYLAIYIRYW